MKDRKDKARAPILAAGGIVLRGDRKPLIAVVQLRKLSAWVLPKGKLAARESAVAAARREVLEETGHDVIVHEFLGTLVYDAGGRSKVVHYWSMEASGEQIRELMDDIRQSTGCRSMRRSRGCRAARSAPSSKRSARWR